MNIAEHFKQLILDEKCALDPALRQRVLNNQLTVRDQAFLTRSWKNANSPETKRIAKKYQSQRNGGAT